MWARLPETIYQGTISYLSVRDCGNLDSTMTNRETRPQLVKAYKNLMSPTFNQHVYTSEDEFRALRWVMGRDINLRGFRLELKDDGYTVRESGDVLTWLMDKSDRYHDMEIAEYYATRGKLTNLDGRHGEHTALTYASQEGHLDIVEALLARGADKNRTDIYGYTPLIWTARRGRVEILKTLLSAGAAKDKAGIYGQTALSWASLNGHVECVKELLAVKVDVNKADEGGWTPLMHASYFGHVEIVKLLLAAGAKKDKINTDGKTALTIATEKGRHEIIQLLQQAA